MNVQEPLVGHQERVQWRGETVLTLAGIWPEEPRAMIVGLNPAPKSVAAGHYYQGAVGQRQLGRLADVGLFSRPAGLYWEEAALAARVGFADLVRRPTTGERAMLDVRASHYAEHREHRGRDRAARVAGPRVEESVLRRLADPRRRQRSGLR